MKENFIGLIKAAGPSAGQLWSNLGRSLRNVGRDTAALGGHYGRRALDFTRDTVIPAADRLGRRAFDYTRNTVLPAVNRFAKNKIYPYWNRLDPGMKIGGGLAGGLGLTYLAGKLNDLATGGSGNSTEDPIDKKYSPFARPIVRYVKDYERATAPIAPININPSGGDTGLEYRNKGENPFGEPSFKIRDPYSFPQH